MYEESPPIEKDCRSYSPQKSSDQAVNVKSKVSGQVLALAVVAVIAILVLGVVVAALVVFRPSTSESNSDNQEIESLKQQLENLRQLVNEHVNNTYSGTVQLQVLSNYTQEDIKFQLQKCNNSILELHVDLQSVQAELQTTIRQIVALQADLQVSKQTFIDNVTNVQTDLLSSKQILEENISAIHLVMQKVSTAQVNISHQLEHLQNQQPFLQTNMSESKLLCPMHLLQWSFIFNTYSCINL